MQNILDFLGRYGVHVLFLVLEILCFYLIVNYNNDQNSIFVNSTSLYASKINNRADKLETYLNLELVNDSLMAENKRLLERLIKSEVVNSSESKTLDSLGQYALIPSLICNKSIHLRNNHFTLCKGSKDGIMPMMGVVTERGLVGIVKEVSDHYAHVITLLHTQSRISSAIARAYNFGDLIWRSSNPMLANLEGIPKHAEIRLGDTVVTSGYSTIFPKDYPIGIIEDFNVKQGSNNYQINVRLLEDLSQTKYVYVVDNSRAQEQQNLEAGE